MIHSLTFTVSMEFETDAVILLIPKQILQIVSSQKLPGKGFYDGAGCGSLFLRDEHHARCHVFQQRAPTCQALLTQMQLQEAASLQLTHDTLAHELGTAREVVSRLLKQFQRMVCFSNPEAVSPYLMSSGLPAYKVVYKKRAEYPRLSSR